MALQLEDFKTAFSFKIIGTKAPVYNFIPGTVNASKEYLGCIELDGIRHEGRLCIEKNTVQFYTHKMNFIVTADFPLSEYEKI